ncbi:unnamed protein product [Rhizopus microsporus]
MTMDDRGKLNHQMLMDSITHKEYSGGIRNNLVGKRGILRQACMGIRPLMMIRGVTSYIWIKDTSDTYTSAKWTRGMITPFRRTTNKPRSPYWVLRDVNDAIMLLSIDL